MNLTLARGTALLLADPLKQIKVLDAESFATHRTQLERAAARLFVLTSLRAPLAPRSVKAELTEELDVSFTLIYPRPAAGLLLFHAEFMKTLGDGYTSVLMVDDENKKELGWEYLSAQNPNLEITVPAPPKKK